jgi:putative IMPACT (imprinted ancient) family translation regulator
LVRAYTKGAKIALDSAVIVEMMPFEILKVQIGYTAFGKLENYLRDSGIEPDEIIFEDNVKLIISIPNKDIERFMADMNEMTSGSALIESAGGIYLPIKDGVRYMPGRGI